MFAITRQSLIIWFFNLSRGTFVNSTASINQSKSALSTCIWKDSKDLCCAVHTELSISGFCKGTDPNVWDILIHCFQRLAWPMFTFGILWKWFNWYHAQCSLPRIPCHQNVPTFPSFPCQGWSQVWLLQLVPPGKELSLCICQKNGADMVRWDHLHKFSPTSWSVEVEVRFETIDLMSRISLRLQGCIIVSYYSKGIDNVSHDTFLWIIICAQFWWELDSGNPWNQPSVQSDETNDWVTPLNISKAPLYQSSVASVTLLYSTDLTTITRRSLVQLKEHLGNHTICIHLCLEIPGWFK